MTDAPNPGPAPVFVERRTYRRRRLVDAARLLPVLAVVLMCLPLLWIGEQARPTTTTYAMIYVFSLWVLLVLIAAFLARYLRTPPQSDPQSDSQVSESDGTAGEA